MASHAARRGDCKPGAPAPLLRTGPAPHRAAVRAQVTI